MNKAHNGVPKAVTRTDELHYSGIFSLVSSPRNHADYSRFEALNRKRPLDNST